MINIFLDVTGHTELLNHIIISTFLDDPDPHPPAMISVNRLLLARHRDKLWDTLTELGINCADTAYSATELYLEIINQLRQHNISTDRIHLINLVDISGTLIVTVKKCKVRDS